MEPEKKPWAEEDLSDDLIARVEELQGPAGWVNWQAARLGMPRRTKPSQRSLMLRPIWEEFAFYSDANVWVNELSVGPFDFIPIGANVRPRVGKLERALVMRRWDHIFDRSEHAAGEHDPVSYMVGGDVGEEMSALLGLALGRRFRSGGTVREAIAPEEVPIGSPNEMYHQPPVLESPHDHPMIPWIVDEVSLEEARSLFELYPTLDGVDAVALVRSARQYVDGLWLADSDPRLAWIKFVGALEAASNRRDDARHEDPVAQLKRHKPALHRLLAHESPEALEAVAGEVARLYWQSSKVWSFVKAFDPGPPSIRPEEDFLRFDWSRLEEAIFTFYDYRSRDLHDGIPWPIGLCQPPEPTESGLTEVANMGYRAHMDKELPLMEMYVFAYLVGGAIRNWWRSFGHPT